MIRTITTLQIGPIRLVRVIETPEPRTIRPQLSAGPGPAKCRNDHKLILQTEGVAL